MSKKIKPYLLLVPHAALTILFAAGLASGIAQSLGVIPTFGLVEPTLTYYREILARADVLQSVAYSLRLAFVSAAASTVIGVALCAVLVVNDKARSGIVRLVQIPIIVPHVVVALFAVILCSQNGLLARAAYLLGLIGEQSDFPMLLYDGYGVGIILAYIWKEAPFILYFVLSLMANINGSLGEAAVNLGAGRWQAFRRVTLPLCRNTILSGFLIIFVFTLGAYELPFILGATKPKALPVLAYIEYVHPNLQNRPYAMALNGIVILISVFSACIYFLLMKNKIKSLSDRK